MYYIKVLFNEIEQDFLFDTGASAGVTFPKSFIKTLKSKGIKVELFKYKGQAQLADNSWIEIEYARIDGVTIGDFTLNNFIVQIHL